MQSTTSVIVILGTGGTIAGAAAEASDNVGYRAAQVGVDQLVAQVPGLKALRVESEQVAQVDSKDMGFALWLELAQRVAHHAARAEVAGIVITHGTDTLEETAYFLQRVLAPAKPVVFAAAMRPATSLQADGPQNLLDAVAVAQSPGACGVMAVLAGRLHSGLDVRKQHPYRLDAFGSGDAGVLGHVEEGALRRHRPWPRGEGLGLALVALGSGDTAHWPRVEIVVSHAGATGGVVRALVREGVHGIVVAGTGNGSVHQQLELALLEAQAAGVRVLRSTRCGDGAVLDSVKDTLPGAGALTPVQARIELMLQLMDRGDAARGSP
jgi:L-asparaginase